MQWWIALAKCCFLRRLLYGIRHRTQNIDRIGKLFDSNLRNQIYPIELMIFTLSPDGNFHIEQFHQSVFSSPYKALLLSLIIISRLMTDKIITQTCFGRVFKFYQHRPST